MASRAFHCLSHSKEFQMHMNQLTALIVGASAVLLVSAAQAQFQGTATPLKNAMTEQQAKAACRAEMRGGKKESRKATDQKMGICVINKMGR
jgi:hypothetical protein